MANGQNSGNSFDLEQLRTDSTLWKRLAILDEENDDMGLVFISQENPFEKNANASMEKVRRLASQGKLYLREYGRSRHFQKVEADAGGYKLGEQKDISLSGPYDRVLGTLMRSSRWLFNTIGFKSIGSWFDERVQKYDTSRELIKQYKNEYKSMTKEEKKMLEAQRELEKAEAATRAALQEVNRLRENQGLAPLQSQAARVQPQPEPPQPQPEPQPQLQPQPQPQLQVQQVQHNVAPQGPYQVQQAAQYSFGPQVGFEPQAQMQFDYQPQQQQPDNVVDAQPNIPVPPVFNVGPLPNEIPVIPYENNPAVPPVPGMQANPEPPQQGVVNPPPPQPPQQENNLQQGGNLQQDNNLQQEQPGNLPDPQQDNNLQQEQPGDLPDPQQDEFVIEEAPPQQDVFVIEEAPPQQDVFVIEEAPPQQDEFVIEEAPERNDPNAPLANPVIEPKRVNIQPNRQEKQEKVPLRDQLELEQTRLHALANWGQTTAKALLDTPENRQWLEQYQANQDERTARTALMGMICGTLGNPRAQDTPDAYDQLLDTLLGGQPQGDGHEILVSLGLNLFNDAWGRFNDQDSTALGEIMSNTIRSLSRAVAKDPNLSDRHVMAGRLISETFRMAQEFGNIELNLSEEDLSAAKGAVGISQVAERNMQARQYLGSQENINMQDPKTYQAVRDIMIANGVKTNMAINDLSENGYTPIQHLIGSNVLSLEKMDQYVSTSPSKQKFTPENIQKILENPNGKTARTMGFDISDHMIDCAVADVNNPALDDPAAHRELDHVAQPNNGM